MSRGDLERMVLNLSSHGVAATKFGVPPAGGASLRRPRLVERLDAGVQGSLILVSAPAGSGKTTMLADWARRRRGRTAWISLDPEDDREDRFWRLAAVAVGRAAEPETPDSLQPLLQTPGPLAKGEIVAALVNALEGMPGGLVLVLDDFHLIESETVHETMALLLTRLPSRTCVVLAGRTEPPLPLSRLRVSGRLTELGAADLRFSAEESAPLLQEAWGFQASKATAAALAERTEGWAAGLQLAALALRDHPDPDTAVHDFTGTHRHVFDYFSEEVLARQSDRVTAFLVRCSLLEELTGPLCDAVTGGTGGTELLKELECANLFLQPMDGERRWYRLHQLFRDLLRARLEQESPSIVPELHRRAGEWYERHGLDGQAVWHAAAIQDWAWVVRLVDPHLEAAIVKGGDFADVDEWLSRLPDAVVRGDIRLCLAKAAIEWHRYRFDEVERLLGSAEAASAAAPGRRYPTHGGTVADPMAAIALLRGEMAGVRRDGEAERRHASTALRHLGSDEHGPRFWARLMTVMAHWHEGRMDLAESGILGLLAETEISPDERLLMLRLLGVTQHYLGRLGDAARTVAEALESAAGNRTASRAFECILQYKLARVLYERGELAEAKERTVRVVDLARQLVESWYLWIGLDLLAWLELAEGKVDAALRHMDEACGQAAGLVDVWPVEAGRARLDLAAGRPDRARAWARRRGMSSEDPVCFANERDYLVYARVLLAEGEPAPARRLLARLGEDAEFGHRVVTVIEVRVLEAMAAKADGDQDGALRALSAALELAECEGHVRVFVDEGRPMADLLRGAVRVRTRGHADALSPRLRAYAAELLRAFPETRTSGRRSDTLTNRELEVLTLVAEGRRNQQIAEHLTVTLDTVKKHMSHIYTKLGVSSRTEALRRARDLNLLH
ncbi:LuxR C-terminal-related transcriptional regulator [Glycomyces sp. TRM65418]|uniref:LuxR C-terminal-related transcriptional regulator n=1 Tax=Glycomyces sp. TRM65418 TaxID=2867006 RepID=UPI001CE5AC88|nr:LuxR C-terminal-related transcriptional regulator [Glycomyces sp. TRM65418]MCC3765606.1 LuxR C-terminal-related transcriptional regulator [Glycomyces sp. TRM65418]QZD55207.1 LuxR C-terminal-related transcriptional regulator [Glycomyces sp. TRM65418]